MAAKLPQTYENHVRMHPPFHYFLLPSALVLLILTIVNVVRHYDRLESWILVLISVMAAVAIVLIRVNPLRAQDRLIRLEERLRLATLLDEPLRSRIGDLSVEQMVALRFASDEEVARLVEKALTEQMKPAEIKKAVVNWRADLFRV
jgi:predicted exporter